MVLRLLSLFLSMVILMSPGRADPLGPADKIAALRAQPGAVYPFILRTTPVSALDDIVTPLQVSARVDLPVIGGAMVTMRVDRALALAGDARVDQVWYLHPDLAPLYDRTLRGLEYTRRTVPPPGVANLSLGPPAPFWPLAPDPADPMHVATRALADAGLVVVVAAGNTGTAPNARPGQINPWCGVEWVLCVGGWDARAGRPWRGTSPADPARPETWPTFVAQAVDVIGPWAGGPKSAARRARDEADADFSALVPPDQRDLYTLETGTSQAAAQVSGAAAQVIHFVQNALAEAAARPGQPYIEMTIPPDRANPALGRIPRLTGSAQPMPDGSLRLRYTLDEPWRMTIQILRDSAIPLPGTDPWQTGAGLVSRAQTDAQFGAYGLVAPQILPVKVTE